jgi:DNA-binding NarL/FixJ family response regulator
MALVADGLTNDEIAQKLYMSPATVRTHVSRAMTKLGVRDGAQLVVLAYETGLVRPKLACLIHQVMSGGCRHPRD